MKPSISSCFAKANFLSFAAFLLAVSLILSCNPAYRHWKDAKNIDSISAYKDFLTKYPKSDFADSAGARLVNLYVLREWWRAQVADSFEAYKIFIDNNSGNIYVDLARTRINQIMDKDWRRCRKQGNLQTFEQYFTKYHDEKIPAYQIQYIEGMKKDSSDWQNAVLAGDVNSLANFLKYHTDSPYAEQAKAKIVDLEVKEIVNNEHGSLPSSDKISNDYVGRRIYSTVKIYNDTDYNLTIRYSGPESFKIEFLPNETGIIEVLVGKYTITASVNAVHVMNYVGEENSDGGDIGFTYVIKSPYTVYPFGAPEPKTDYWPIKRTVADYLK